MEIESFILLSLLFVLLVLLSGGLNEMFPGCFGLSHRACLSDISCEWNPYHDGCQSRTNNYYPIYGRYLYPYRWGYRRHVIPRGYYWPFWKRGQGRVRVRG